MLLFLLSLLLQQREFQMHQLELVGIIQNENHEYCCGHKKKRKKEKIIIMMMIISSILCFIDSEGIRKSKTNRHIKNN